MRLETLLKRYIKRRVSYTLGIMVGFLITGGIVLGASNPYTVYNNKTTTSIDDSEYKIEATANTTGVSVYNLGTNVIVNSENIIISNVDNITTQGSTIKGIELFNGGNLTLGKEGSQVNIKVDTTNGYAIGANIFNSPNGDKTQVLEINGDVANISATSNSDNAIGVYIGSGDYRANNSIFRSNAKETIIEVVAGMDKDAVAILSTDGGIVELNSGNITITGDTAISVNGNSKVEINKDNSNSNNINLNGDIVFQKYSSVVSGANNSIDSDVTINLNNSNSQFTGRIGLELGKNIDNVPDSERVVNGLKLSISNGATWNIKTEEGKDNYIFGDISVKDSGKINNSGTSLVYNNDGRNLGIQMQGKAILSGSGIISTGRNLAGQENTDATNIITVTNTGNIIENGSNLTFGGNVNITENSDLENQGTISTGKNFLVGKGATFTNAKGAVIKGTANNQHVIEVAGGTAINNGTIDLTGRTGSYAMYGDENSTLTNNGTVIVDYKNGTGSKVFNDEGIRTNTNTGIVKVNGYDGNTTLEAKKELEEYLLGAGANINTGMIVDENGQAISFGDEVTGEMTVTETLRKVLGTGGITTGANATILADGNSIEGTKENGLLSLNVTGELSLKASGSNKSLDVVGITTNLDADGVIKLDSLNANFKNGTINSENKGIAIKLGTNNLSLEDMIVKANIGDGTGILNTLGSTSIIGDIKTTNVNVNSGRTDFNGNLTTDNVKISKDSEAYFSANSSFTNGTEIIGDGTSIFEVISETENAISNSTGVTVGTNFGFDTSEVTEENLTIDFGDTFKDGTYVEYAGGAYGQSFKDGVLTISFNKNLLAKYGANYNNIYNSLRLVRDKYNGALDTEEENLAVVDKIYTGTIYADTVRMSYDNSKLVENELLKLNPEVATGEWVANGKALYMKNEYNRDGVVTSYRTEKESAGLLAAAEYGLNDTTNLGLAFAGVNHDIDTDTGKSDGDAFYFGAFAKKELGNYRVTAGLGYTFNRFDSDENIFGGSEKYDANVYSAYVEGRYSKDLGDNVIFEPKLKLGYTYVDQDSIQDGTYKLDSQDIGIFDTEVGADLVKTVALKDGRLDVVFGASYAMAFGDTDDEFEGRFYNATEVGTSFNMMGANVAERTANFGLGLGVTKDSGVFYNGGVTFKAGSDSYREYGVTLGAGYKF